MFLTGFLCGILFSVIMLFIFTLKAKIDQADKESR